MRTSHGQVPSYLDVFEIWSTIAPRESIQFGGFHKWGVPLVIIHFRLGFSHINHPASLGYPHGFQVDWPPSDLQCRLEYIELLPSYSKFASNFAAGGFTPRIINGLVHSSSFRYLAKPTLDKMKPTNPNAHMYDI